MSRDNFAINGAVNVSALSDARFGENGGSVRDALRAFDKAVRRKPPVGAADAAMLWRLDVRDSGVDTGRPWAWGTGNDARSGLAE